MGSFSRYVALLISIWWVQKPITYKILEKKTKKKRQSVMRVGAGALQKCNGRQRSEFCKS